MTNEELAMQIQQGNKNAIAELWTAVTPFIYKCCYRFYHARTELCLSSGVTADDLIQTAFFALLNAVNSFDIATGYKL